MTIYIFAEKIHPNSRIGWKSVAKNWRKYVVEETLPVNAKGDLIPFQQPSTYEPEEFAICANHYIASWDGSLPEEKRFRFMGQASQRELPPLPSGDSDVKPPKPVSKSGAGKGGKSKKSKSKSKAKGKGKEKVESEEEEFIDLDGVGDQEADAGAEVGPASPVALRTQRVVRYVDEEAAKELADEEMDSDCSGAYAPDEKALEGGPGRGVAPRVAKSSDDPAPIPGPSIAGQPQSKPSSPPVPPPSSKARTAKVGPKTAARKPAKAKAGPTFAGVFIPAWKGDPTAYSPIRNPSTFAMSRSDVDMFDAPPSPSKLAAAPAMDLDTPAPVPSMPGLLDPRAGPSPFQPVPSQPGPSGSSATGAKPKAALPPKAIIWPKLHVRSVKFCSSTVFADLTVNTVHPDFSGLTVRSYLSLSAFQLS